MAGFQILPGTTFLSLGHANIGERFADALLNVRWLHWQGCPRDFEAISIQLENLVILDLSWSKVTESWGGWKGIKVVYSSLAIVFVLALKYIESSMPSEFFRLFCRWSI